MKNGQVVFILSNLQNDHKYTNSYIAELFHDIFKHPSTVYIYIIRQFETYLVKLPDNLRIPFTKFCCRNHKLPIEYGIYARVDRNNRLCIHCDKLGDEFHYPFECVKFHDQRKLF